MGTDHKKSDTDRLAHELAEEMGETITEAVTVALRERLSTIRRNRNRGRMEADIATIQDFVESLPDRDGRSAEDVLGYDEYGLPR